MAKRCATALLALLVLLTGAGVCARGVQACSAMGTAAKDCCGKAVKLSASDCCCPAKADARSGLPSTLLNHAASANPLLTVAPAILPTVAGPDHAVFARTVARALAPPDTPVARHTSLLL